MAGTNPDFNATEFRDGIRLAMDMAAPVNEGERATFYFPSTLIYNDPELDSEGVPFDKDNLPVSSTPTPPKQVTCAVEFFDSQGNPTNFGTVVPARADITLLDEEWAEVEGFSYVALKGERYNLRDIDYPVGMFDVGIYTIHLVAANRR